MPFWKNLYCLSENCAGCCGETRHDSVEAAYALVVLGREPDRRAEQRGEVPRAVTRRALQARDRGRRGRVREARCERVRDRGMHQKPLLLEGPTGGHLFPKASTDPDAVTAEAMFFIETLMR